jgi:hypothetical protein
MLRQTEQKIEGTHFLFYTISTRPSCNAISMTAKFWAASYKIYLILLLLRHRSYGHKHNFSHQTRLEKCGRVNHGALKDSSWLGTFNNSNIPQSKPNSTVIFSSNRSAPANRKKGFYTNCVLIKQEIGGIFECISSELWRLLIFKIRTKKSKTYSSWCPYQGLYNGITLIQI